MVHLAMLFTATLSTSGRDRSARIGRPPEEWQRTLQLQSDPKEKVPPLVNSQAFELSI
ncbi:hypothetical protein [Halomicronema sp. CCY15110]|uniref:hypothetical protein n=1 Tax=Halomicronema sp. CCY15110 TaxID=2767773 RepID=UPI001951C108|nr:hypothetical protein [Halomicronema sp. CCY15110]